VGESLYLTPQLGLLHIAAHARISGAADVEIVDLALELREGTLDRVHPLEAAARRLAAVDCDTYGFSVQCFNLPIAVRIAQRLKARRPRRPVVFGGHEATLIRQQAVMQLPWIEWDTPAWFPTDAAGEWYRLPRDLGPSLERYSAISRQPTGLVEVARGCPFACSFCSIPVAFGHRRSYKPLQQMREELLEQHAVGVRNIHFVDDTLTLHRERLDAFLTLLEDLKLDFAWTGMTRVDLVDAAMLLRMARTGCYSLLYGVESVDAGVRLRLSKGGRPYPDLQRFLQWHIDAGLQPTLYFLVGLPQESPAALHATLRIAARLSAQDPGSCHFQLPRIVPGTRLHSEVGEELQLNLDSGYAATLLQTAGDDRTELVAEIAARPQIYSTYYARSYDADPLARIIDRLGDALYARWPLTLVSLCDAGHLIDWLRSPQLMQAASVTDVEPALERFVSMLGPTHSDILRFERWLRDPKADSILSRVDADALQLHLRDGRPLTQARRSALVAYRKTHDQSVLAL
jgi:radical SAM superfamily enzyme YgiQ (UPF0313 family)